MGPLSNGVWQTTWPTSPAFHWRLRRPENFRNSFNTMQLVNNKAGMELCFPDSQLVFLCICPIMSPLQKRRPFGKSLARRANCFDSEECVFQSAQQSRSLQVWAGGESTSRRAFWPAPSPSAGVTALGGWASGQGWCWDTVFWAPLVSAEQGPVSRRGCE